MDHHLRLKKMAGNLRRIKAPMGTPSNPGVSGRTIDEGCGAWHDPPHVLLW